MPPSVIALATEMNSYHNVAAIRRKQTLLADSDKEMARGWQPVTG